MNDCNQKLSWRERISFCSGDLAQNTLMFLVVRIVDLVWDPFVGALIDRSNPRWGKYRSWLVLGGVPLAGFAILCFWNGFSGSLLICL